MKHRIEGFHGTSFENAEKVILQDFNPSVGDKEWLGDGVYFFTRGINDNPSNQAEKWSIAQSWDNNKKEYRYKKYAVLKCHIEVDDDNFLDLTTSDGVEVLDYIIEHHMAKMKEIGKKFTYIDGFVINFAREEGLIPVEVAKGNFYIKFTKERVRGLNRRTPNCTICSVYKPKKLIKQKHLLLTNEIS